MGGWRGGGGLGKQVCQGRKEGQARQAVGGDRGSWETGTSQTEEERRVKE